MTKRVGISVGDPAAAGAAERLLGCLPDAADDADGRYEIRAAETGRFVLEGPDGFTCECRSWLDAYYRMDSHIYDVLFPGEKNVFVFHSAALRHRPSGRVIWLMGPSMCGKSTLSLHLAARGAFEYLSEEAVGVDPRTGEMVPFPRGWRLRGGAGSLVLKGISWDVVTDPACQKTYVIPPAGVAAAGLLFVKPFAAVFPAYQPENTEPHFFPLSGGFLLAYLMTFCVNGAGFHTGERIRFLSDYCREIRGGAMQWGDVSKAVRRLEGLVRA